jgi:hypothetical protein
MLLSYISSNKKKKKKKKKKKVWEGMQLSRLVNPTGKPSQLISRNAWIKTIG